MNCYIKQYGYFKVEDPECGDFKLSVMPFEHTEDCIKLPKGFDLWENSLNKIMKHVPHQADATTHYVTIDTKFFSQAGTLRREGIHIDGNFCVDPSFTTPMGWGGGWAFSRISEDAVVESKQLQTWGGSQAEFFRTNDGVILKGIKKNWVSEFTDEIPVGDYVSEHKGGLLVASSEVGCLAWIGHFDESINDGGDCSGMENQFSDANSFLLEKNKLYFMTSNTPHKTLDIEKGTRRTLIRVTLNHNYDNRVLFHNDLMEAS